MGGILDRTLAIVPTRIVKDDLGRYIVQYKHYLGKWTDNYKVSDLESALEYLDECRNRYVKYIKSKTRREIFAPEVFDEIEEGLDEEGNKRFFKRVQAI